MSNIQISFRKITPKPDPNAGIPCSRSSHGLSFTASTLVLLGGEHIARTPLSPDQILWTATQAPDGTWQWRRFTPKDPSPSPRVAHSQACIGEKIYIFGGRTGIDMDETALEDMWVLDLPTETWSQIEQGGEVPEARSFHKMIAVGESLYLFGGCGKSGRLADLHRFDTVEKKWVNLGNSALKGRGGPNILSLKDKDDKPYLAMVAGFAGQETNDGHAYHLDKGAWSPNTMSLGDLRPRSVCVFGSLPTQNLGVIFGGEVDPSDKGHEGAGGFTNDLVILDGASGKIVKTIPAEEKDWPENRGWADGCTDGKNSLYVFGGLSGDDENPRRLDDLWVCDITSA